MSNNEDLWRRLMEAHASTLDAGQRLSRASRTRAALVDALVRDGATYGQIGSALGVTRQRAFRMRREHPTR